MCIRDRYCTAQVIIRFSTFLLVTLSLASVSNVNKVTWRKVKICGYKKFGRCLWLDCRLSISEGLVVETFIKPIVPE